MNDTVIILLAIGAIVGVWVVMKFFDGAKEKLVKIKEYPIDKRNKQKEVDFLNDLLQDIQDNTHNWTYTGYNHSSMASMSVINDVKNIAIILNEPSLLRNASAVAVNFGQKDISEYRSLSGDNISIHMQGKHVTEFCIQVEDALDSRGHELDFFKEQIKNKL